MDRFTAWEMLWEAAFIKMVRLVMLGNCCSSEPSIRDGAVITVRVASGSVSPSWDWAWAWEAVAAWESSEVTAGSVAVAPST